MSEEKFELYVGETTKLENTKLNIQGNAKIDGRVSGEIETRLLEIGPNGVVEGKVQANRIVLEGTLDSGSGSVVARVIEIKKGGKLAGSVQYSSFLYYNWLHHPLLQPLFQYNFPSYVYILSSRSSQQKKPVKIS